jgi:hypothetical protein
MGQRSNEDFNRFANAIEWVVLLLLSGPRDPESSARLRKPISHSTRLTHLAGAPL